MSLKQKGEEVFWYWNGDSPAVCGEDHGEAGCCPAAHGVPWQSRFAPCSLWRTPCHSRWMYPEGGCGLWRTYTGAGSPGGHTGEKSEVEGESETTTPILHPPALLRVGSEVEPGRMKVFFVGILFLAILPKF